MRFSMTFILASLCLLACATNPSSDAREPDDSTAVAPETEATKVEPQAASEAPPAEGSRAPDDAVRKDVASEGEGEPEAAATPRHDDCPTGGVTSADTEELPFDGSCNDSTSASRGPNYAMLLSTIDEQGRAWSFSIYVDASEPFEGKFEVQPARHNKTHPRPEEGKAIIQIELGAGNEENKRVFLGQSGTVILHGREEGTFVVEVRRWLCSKEDRFGCVESSLGEETVELRGDFRSPF